MKQIENICTSISTVKYPKHKDKLMRNLTILRGELTRWKTTTEEDRVYDEYFSQLLYAEGTLKHMEDLLKAHTGDSERELIKILKANNVDINAYFGGSIVGNHCMYFGEYGENIMNDMKKAMQPKIKDVNNKTYLTNICVRMKHILKLWYGMMRTMKSVQYQTDDDCKKFEEDTIELNKALHSLIDDPPFQAVGSSILIS